jgi:hypothetical protein
MNQTDLQERSQQVRLMKWIYAQSTGLDIYIGKEDDTSTAAFIYARNATREEQLQSEFKR